MTKIFVILALSGLSGCGQADTLPAIDRPSPPRFVADGNAPTATVAVDFIRKYTAITQAAIDRTPYGIKDLGEQMRVAQELYNADGEYLEQWREAGISLFEAAHSNVCKLFVLATYSAWREAYPLNGPPVEAELKKKRERADYAGEMGNHCLHQTTLPVWGT